MTASSKATMEGVGIGALAVLIGVESNAAFPETARVGPMSSAVVATR